MRLNSPRLAMVALSSATWRSTSGTVLRCSRILDLARSAFQDIACSSDGIDVEFDAVLHFHLRRAPEGVGICARSDHQVAQGRADPDFAELGGLRLFVPGGGVDCGAEQRDRDPVLGAEVAEGDVAGMQADAQAKRQAVLLEVGLAFRRDLQHASEYGGRLALLALAGVDEPV